MTDYAMHKYSDEYLFRQHSKETVKRWLSQLRYFYFFRAWGGHANDGDMFETAFSITDKQDRDQKLMQLGIDPVGYGSSRKELWGCRVYIREHDNQLILTIAGNSPYDVSEEDFLACLHLEQKLDELGWQQAVDRSMELSARCISRMKYPELYEPNTGK